MMSTQRGVITHEKEAAVPPARGHVDRGVGLESGGRVSASEVPEVTDGGGRGMGVLPDHLRCPLCGVHRKRPRGVCLTCAREVDERHARKSR